MTREEAIKHGEEQLEIFGGEHKEFIQMAIRSLTAWQKVKVELKHEICKEVHKKDRYTLHLVM